MSEHDTEAIFPILESDPIRKFNRTTKDAILYMVYCPTAGFPRATHKDFITALTESQRLAKNNPGSKFFVLQTILVSQSEITPVRSERMID